jgi:hypothetical protein
MRFLTPPQTLSEARHRQFPAYEILPALLIAGAAISAAGTAYSANASSQAQKRNASANRSAALANAAYEKASAQAQAQISRYQNELNLKTARAQAQQYSDNAKILHQFARSQEVQGNEQINRSYQQEEAMTSQVEAAYGASGIAADTGSPLMVEAHNAGMAQLARMDAAYKTNLAALDTDWKGTLQTYQSQVQMELSKQYEYGMQMADWNNKMGNLAYENNVSFANASYNNSIQSANDTATAGYINATGSLLSAAGGFMKPSTTGGGLGSQADANKALGFTPEMSSWRTVPRATF